MRTYKIDHEENQKAINQARALRRRLESEILDLFYCEKCGEDEPPFLDYFDLDLEIKCECGHAGRLRDFCDHNR